MLGQHYRPWSISSVADDTSPSAWMHSLINVFSWRQAGTGQSHEMDIIFCRLSAISRMLLHPYFVFDGPDCPQLKRGKDVVGSTFPRLLVQRFQELLTAFGFNWHMAPGEADVELANLQSYGLIEAVVTPYNDALLFGATCIIRSGTPYSTRYEDVLVYSSKDIENVVSLELGDLYLILLMSSVDAEVIGGAAWTLPVGWQKYGFGRSLLRAAAALQFAEFMSFVSKWRDSVCEVLRTDPRQFLGCRHYELARIIVEERIEFPDPAVLAMYLLPLTSWSDNGRPPITVVTSRQPDLMSLVEFCSQYLDWPPDVIQSRLVDARAGAAVRALLQVSSAIINTSTPHHHPPYPAARQCQRRETAT
ncbi:PIN domain-like protein [Pisolithus orientalis]|uniref:PIN domain-like protein n=1 Tax=Pisolithus orientalis TaxID=936130 RepID=UPI0022256533|nr:PIN domain-like protein [Pisolithus orientalis]KAI5988655.1 PIN domain-like protein [Pisolithus orientalis]